MRQVTQYMNPLAVLLEHQGYFGQPCSLSVSTYFCSFNFYLSTNIVVVTVDSYLCQAKETSFSYRSESKRNITAIEFIAIG